MITLSCQKEWFRIVLSEAPPQRCHAAPESVITAPHISRTINNKRRLGIIESMLGIMVDTQYREIATGTGLQNNG